jgi:hypothetical protein
MDLTAHVTGRNLILAGSVFALTQMFKQAFPAFWASACGQRLLPVVPVALGVVAMFLRLGDGAARWTDKLVTGVMVGAVAATSFQVGKQTILGWGTKSDSTSAPAAPSTPPKE